MYAVLVYMDDCGDKTVFLQRDSRGRDGWNTFEEARIAMRADYEVTSAEYSPVWSVDGKDKRKRRILKSSAEFSVPIWDGERKRDSELKCKWKIVRI